MREEYMVADERLADVRENSIELMLFILFR